MSIMSLGLRNKSSFRPPYGSHAVETFIGFIQDSFHTLRDDIEKGRLHYPPNLSPTEHQAFMALQKDSTLVIKPADKGGALVVMDKIQYIKEIHRQFNDTSVYDRLSRDPTSEIRGKIDTVISKYSDLGIIDTKTSEFLRKSNPITPVFYTLPKIHKDLSNPPGRPIVASTDSILSPLSIYLEKILTPITQTSPSFILDTGEFLKCIKELGRVSVDTILVTLDVKDLYTSIPHLNGINAVHHSLTTAGLTTNQINLCVELLTIVLHNNFFLFQDTFYLQKRGTAMGSNVAPPYANTYMTEFETYIIYKHPLFRNVSLWKRFIDDIFCIWGGTLESLQEFFLFLNGAWPGIKFTISHDSHSINFLDTMVLKDQADLFTKPTDKNSLLHYHSFHPPSTKRSIPISQFQRVKRIVPDRTLCENRLQNMTSKFIERGYPPRVLAQSRDPPPRHSTRDQGKRIPFVHSYHPFSFILHKAIRRHWHLLSTAHPDIPEFRSPFLPCFRRPPNLRDGLVKADIGSADQRRQLFLSRPRNGTFPCLHCAQCHNVLKGNTFQHPRSGKTFRINQFFTCESSYVVYLIKCPCGLLYVGETTQSVRDRISKHKSTIRCQNLLLPIPHHFHSAGLSISQLRYQVIDRAPPPRRGGDRVALLHRKEAFWIHTLETLAPKGLNRDYELMAFVLSFVLLEALRRKGCTAVPLVRHVNSLKVDYLIYPCPKHAAMRSYVKESLEKGHIRPSSSPLGAGFFFVAKKDGSLRPCIDYRLLNKITVKFQYPLPLLSDLFFARIKGASWFTKIDPRGAYNLVRIRQGDEWKTAFNTPEGHFEYLVMPFGLANAPSVFQSFMHDIFREYLDKFLIVYLDDILIFSDDWESHVKQVEVDASEIGAGAVLSQRGSDCSVMKPCAFFSRKFSPAERNYDVGNRELLAMKWAFEEWRHWLEGPKHRVVVLTDHKNLTYLESAKRLNPRQARWSLFFARFDFVISYLPGSKNVKADALSRSFVPDSPGLSEPAGILKEGVIVSAISPDLRRVLQKFQANKPDRCPAEKLFVPDRSLLRRYVAPMVPSVEPPARFGVEGELEYIVEKILDSRVSRRKLQYLLVFCFAGSSETQRVYRRAVSSARTAVFPQKKPQTGKSKKGYPEQRIPRSKGFKAPFCLLPALPTTGYLLFTEASFHPPSTLTLKYRITPGFNVRLFVLSSEGSSTVVNSVAEFTPVVTSGTAASELPPSGVLLVFCFAGSSETQRVYRRAVSSARKFPKGRLFNLSVSEHAAMRSYVKESLEKGHIRPSSSPLGAGFFFVAKKDGSLRPCIDYRLLNKITVKFQYPLPLLSDLFARIKGASWFTKIDPRGAYNLVRIRQGDEWKTAFNTPEGHFEYLVMPFGLANAPSVFQSFMHDIFREYLDKFLIVYLDDILIFSDDWESHVKQKVSFLGFIFTPSTIEMDPVKVQAIQDWIQPTSLKSLQKFLGFANFYRRFICNFSSIAKPLTDLTKKGSFSPAERNYDVGNRELLAMKWAFEEWRHWLEGPKHRVVVLTDHKNLTYLESAKRLNPRQARWSLFFARFDFVISYLPGSKNVESSDCPGVDSVVDRLQQIWTQVVDNLILSQEKAQLFANRRRRLVFCFAGSSETQRVYRRAVSSARIKRHLCTPSNSLTPNSTMVKTKELSKDTRNKIVALHQAGKTESAIANQLGVKEINSGSNN
ncbi:unnamed protein product [Ranitomeya imitator]|uniref:ribonuclease H n=1 Tax=Ranitomeya imitator TaxID=111125 RepID=A0ABN9L441_9NEOB|nr:unnamed protein product [Ranitomeya imitator]